MNSHAELELLCVYVFGEGVEVEQRERERRSVYGGRGIEEERVREKGERAEGERRERGQRGKTERRERTEREKRWMARLQGRRRQGWGMWNVECSEYARGWPRSLHHST